MSMTKIAEYDALVVELLAEAHGLRMKYEEFSLYTEARIAELVLERKPMATEIDQLSHDLRVTNAQREQIQADLVVVTNQLAQVKDQLEHALARIKNTESSRSYILASRVNRFLAHFSRSK